MLHKNLKSTSNLNYELYNLDIIQSFGIYPYKIQIIITIMYSCVGLEYKKCMLVAVDMLR